MEIIRHGEKLITENSAVALGNFDGLHTAHMEIINSCRKYARENGLKSGVLLFDEHTLNIIRGERVALITDKQSKLDILNKAELDFVYCRKFDDSFMKLSPDGFAKELKNTMNVSAVFVGYDYRFGFKAQGDTAELIRLGNKYGFDVFITDKVEYKGKIVKSSEIRELISNGEIETATHMLGRAFSITGKVERGLGNGHKIGIPTANVSYEDDMLLPQKGVYAGYTHIDGVKYKSVINVGNNPTFGAEKITIESHIMDFDSDIYDKTATVEFVFKIRDDVKFNGINELVSQIHKDINFAKNNLK